MARLQECSCGSGLYPNANHDGYGIFMCYSCPKCHDEKMKGYRSDIYEHYDADEPIEPEDDVWEDDYHYSDGDDYADRAELKSRLDRRKS